MREQPVGRLSKDVPASWADRLSALFDAHADRLYRIARRLVSSRDDAQDLVQETFLRAARAPESISTNAEAWLVRVLVNIRRDQWRKERTRSRHAGDVRHAAEAANDPETVFLTHERVWRALDVLKPRRRAILVMHELEGLAIADIASLLSVNAVTIRWHLARGRRELARALEVGGGKANEHPQNSVAERRPAPARNAAP